MSKSDFLSLGILAGLCLLVGVCLIISLPLIGSDGVFYIVQARRILHDPLAVARQHPPGYPFLLWVGHALTSLFAARDGPDLWARSAQGTTLLCRVLALVPLYFLGKRLVGPRDSFLALLILVVLPYPAYYGSDVLREWPYVLFLSLGFWMLYRGLCDGTRWPFALAGLAAGLGYLIRPECVQLLIYGLLGLTVAAHRSNSASRGAVNELRDTWYGWRFLGAVLLLVVGFAVPAAPYIRVMGTILPQQLRPATSNAPPVIVRAGSRLAGDDALEFEVGAGQLLEVPFEAFDPENQPLTSSLVGVPVGSRPVYQFRSVATGTRFWTLSENERTTLLTTYYPQVWQYDGIAGYAYAQPGPAAGLQPVHRFWSAARQRHFYTISESEREALVRRASAPEWQYEGVTFYAFAEGNHPPDAVPVYRIGSDLGIADGGPGSKSGVTTMPMADLTPDTNPPSNRVAWYVLGAGAPPAGAVIENRVLCWRPRSDQQGEYQINIVVSDGRSGTCQLVKVRVQPPGETSNIKHQTSKMTQAGRQGVPGPKDPVAPPPSGMSGSQPGAAGPHGWARLPEAADQLFDAVAEDLMVVFLVPWLLGLYYRLRYQAGRPGPQDRCPTAPLCVGAVERVLMPALLLVNIAAMLARYAWIAPGTNRRYSLGLLALTIFYIPAGLQLIAAWLERGLRIYDLRFTIYDLLALLRIVRPRQRPQGNDHKSTITNHKSKRGVWSRRTSIRGRNLQYILLAVGIGICLCKFFRTPTVDKSSYRVMGQWLRENTVPDAVLAVPDVRISFYADRPGLLYRQHLDPRCAGYVVKVEDQNQPAAPTGWRREYSIPFNRGKRGQAAVAYRIMRAQ